MNLTNLKIKKKILITIDDGFKSFYNEAWPYLKKNKIPFILFISTKPVGNYGYMSWDEIKEIDDSELGLFFYSKERLVDDSSIKDKFFSTMSERVQNELDLQKLSSYLGWNGLGQLHRFKPEGFSSGVENTSVVKLDLNELQKFSPLVNSF